MANPLGEVVGYCLKCKEPIGKQTPSTYCLGCGEPLTAEIKAQLPRLNPEPQQTIVSSQSQKSEIVLSNASPRVAAVAKRYNDAYFVARATVGFGDLIKVIGILLAIGILLLAFWVGSQNPPSRDSSIGLGLAIVIGIFGVFGGTLLYLLGVLVAAQGQTLKASLDSAVNNSPFLTDEHKAQVMSLPAA